VHGRLYGAGELLLFRFSLRPVNQNTNNIVRGMRHRGGEERVVAFGGFIGLFRAEGRKGSPIVRSYLHTNGTMVIRDAPLEALEALECVELSSPPFLSLYWCFCSDYILR